MKLGYFTMPIHPVGKDWRLSLREDREAFILADKLGFIEGYVGEHATDLSENITSSTMFLSTLVDAVKSMKLGTGTLNLANSHPVNIAVQVAMLDHLLDGRFIMGIGPGGLLSDFEVYETLDADRAEIFLETINQILALWANEPPYDLVGKYRSISTSRTRIAPIGQGYIAKPLQRPHPPIVVSVSAPYSKGVAEAAARGWDPISANFIMPRWVKSHWDGYVEGCERVGRPALRDRWRVGKNIFVADDRKTARDYATGPNSPYHMYFSQLMMKSRAGGRLLQYKISADVPDDAVTVEGVCEELVVYGTPEEVADKLLAFREQVGDFGTLLYVGHDWRDPDLGRRSMILMAEKVMPAINAAIGAPQAPAKLTDVAAG